MLFFCLASFALFSSIAWATTNNSPAILAAASPLNNTQFVDSQFATGMSRPTSMAFSPDGRLFVSEQGGELRVIKNGTLLNEPFLSVDVSRAGYRGLGGVEFDPEFDTNGYVYVYYTTSSDPIHSRISRFTASESNPDLAAAGSEVTILELEDLGNNTLHNGGAIHFGTDGKLYVGVGYNTDATSPQSLSTRLGKILRINPDGSIPSDNPFINSTGAMGEIWALGFRNPFTFAIRPGTDTMYINDVGQSSWEEINSGIKGGNYGWPVCEGPCPESDFIEPIYAYEHSPGESRAITGGTFYEGTQFPEEYRGSYFFGDFVSSFIKRLTPDNQVVDFIDNAIVPVDIDLGPDGSLYYLSFPDGSVHQVSYAPQPEPPQPEPTASTVDSPVMKDTEGQALIIGYTRQTVVLSTTVVNNNQSEMQFLTLIEARTSDDVTRYLEWQVYTLQSQGSAEIELSWVPNTPGFYQLRTFAVSGLDNPQILTGVATSEVVISSRE